MCRYDLPLDWSISKSVGHFTIGVLDVNLYDIDRQSRSQIGSIRASIWLPKCAETSFASEKIFKPLIMLQQRIDGLFVDNIVKHLQTMFTTKSVLKLILDKLLSVSPTNLPILVGVPSNVAIPSSHNRNPAQ